MWSWIENFSFFGGGVTAESDEMSAYRAMSGFKQDEIHRLQKIFALYAQPDPVTCQLLLTKEQFLSMDCIINNPLAGY